MPEFDRGMMRRSPSGPYGGYGEVFGGQMGSTPRAQNRYMSQMPGLNPQGWGQSRGLPGSFPMPASQGQMEWDQGQQDRQMGMGMISGMAGGGGGGGGIGMGGGGGQGGGQGGGGGGQGGGGGGGFGSYEDWGMPDMQSVGGANSITLPNGTRIDLRNPDAITIAAMQGYGDLARTAMQRYQAELQHKQGMYGIDKEYGWRPWELEQNQAEALRQREFQERMMGQNFEETARERASREGMQKYGLEEGHRQSLDMMGQMPDFISSLGGGLGGLGGGGGGGLGGLGGGGGGGLGGLGPSPTAAPTSQLVAGGAGGAGMFENALQGRVGAMEAGNAAGTEQQRQGMLSQATGPGGGGMANANAAMGARLQHGNMMADVQGKQNLRQQMMAEQQLGIGRMGGAAGLLGALRG